MGKALRRLNSKVKNRARVRMLHVLKKQPFSFLEEYYKRNKTDDPNI